jgi:hypothetical protein
MAFGKEMGSSTDDWKQMVAFYPSSMRARNRRQLTCKQLSVELKQWTVISLYDKTDDWDSDQHTNVTMTYNNNIVFPDPTEVIRP